MTQQDTDTVLGDLLRELRINRGMSVKRLAKVAVVARKTIDNVENGQNISVFVLKKLLRALGVEEITIRVAGAHSARTALITPETIASAADEIRRSTETLLKTAASLDALTVAGREDDDLGDQAEDLIKDFTRFVRTVDNPQQLASVRETVTSLATPGRKHDQSSKSRPRKRRTA